MIDIEQIRRDPEQFRRAIKAKRVPVDLDELLDCDKTKRSLTAEVNLLRQERNRLTQLVAAGANKHHGGSGNTTEHQGDKQAAAPAAYQGQGAAAGNPNPVRTSAAIDESKAAARQVNEQLVLKEAELASLQTRYASLMALMPGLPAEGVPEGASDADNVELRRHGQLPDQAPWQRDHIELAKLHGMLDFDGARLAAGTRAYALLGDGVLLELAVLRFALDHLLQKGFIPVLPPLMVRQEAMFGTGYFPLGEANAYEFEKDKLFLTGTSEVGTVAIHANKVFEHSELPLRYAGISACFRREAGSAGRDTKGLYRVHQFQKVEQIVLTHGDKDLSLQEHYNLLGNAEEILQALELPYRIVAVCTGDMGLGQVLKHDIETWMPSRNNFGETHSCSSFHDFQARRLGIKCRDLSGQKKYVYTLNNTALASPRILIPLLENHQNHDGSINLPAALRPYMGGRKVLEPR